MNKNGSECLNTSFVWEQFCVALFTATKVSQCLFKTKWWYYLDVRLQCRIILSTMSFSFFLCIIFCSVFKVSHQCSSVHQVKKQLRPMRLVLLLVALQLLTIWGRRITGLFWSTCLFKQHDAESKPNILAFALIRSHEEKSTSQTSCRASYRVTTAFSNQVTLRLSCIVILLCFSHYSQVKAIYLQSIFVNNKSWRKCFAERWRYRIIWLMITIKRKHKICERKAKVN